VDSGNTRRLLPSRCVPLPKGRQHLTQYPNRWNLRASSQITSLVQ
jgi:hypothetical protein